MGIWCGALSRMTSFVASTFAFLSELYDLSKEMSAWVAPIGSDVGGTKGVEPGQRRVRSDSYTMHLCDVI